ncbi:hypothetical protein [Pseudomonas japonica]|uniref:hypothetical protein n=1 Tax=Pseudomonas japonica TaxID=256466 RepID=UPI0015E46F18|nr:hypothetical protein [Pseudomonas japonica]MBA1245916.1 hypothetical protein [Pseudomonas japonica]
MDGQKSLHNQLIVVSKDGKVEHWLSGHLRKTRESLWWGESNPLNWGTIFTYKTIENVLNSVGDIEGVSLIKAADASALTFPPGHPRERLVYAKHPVKRDMYFPLSGFHRFTFEHKFSEIMNILASLGAVTIQAEHVKGWGKEFAFNATASFANSEAVNASVGQKGSENSRLLFTCSFPGHSVPVIPSDLAWYKFEPLWQTIANNRIQHGLKQFALTLSYTEDYGINAALSAQMKKASLEVGGNFEEYQSTVWTLSGTFA